MKALLCSFVLGITVLSTNVFARGKSEPFKVGSVDVLIDHVDGMLVKDFIGSDSQDVLLIGRDDKRNKQLQLLALDKGQLSENKGTAVMLPQDALLYDTAKLAGSDKLALLLLHPDKITRFDPASGQFDTLVKTESLYRNTLQQTSFANEKDFAMDVNNDGLSDLIVADFRQTRIYLQQKDGTFAPPQSIDMVAQMRLFRNNSAVYNASTLYLGDYNFDGLPDLIYRVKSQLHIFLQTTSGFATKPTEYALSLAQPLSDEYDDVERDHSNMRIHSFYRLMDLNGDKVLDLITQLTRSSGLFDKASQYQVYFGAKNAQGVMAFGSTPDSVIGSKGLQFELQLQDFDGDNRLDLLSPSYELGVGSIIASLFSSSADLEIGFHRLGSDGRYAAKPNLEKELTVDFDLSSGQNVYPLIKVNDFDGDGINDLLLGHGTKKLYLFNGEQGDKLFARRAEKFRIPLPRDARYIASADLNQDGKTDLVIRYSKLDSKNGYKQMKILLAQ